MSRRLSCLTEGDYKIYQISSKNKVAQLKATSDSDYYAFFCDKIGNVYGIVHTAQKEKRWNRTIALSSPARKNLSG